MTDSVIVLHKSEHYIVINKSPDLVINTDHPEKHSVTVENLLKKKFPHLAAEGFRFCHRLDFSTSGIICIALSKSSARHASHAFERRNVDKYYLAVLHGHVKDVSLVINEMIGNDTRPDFQHCMCTSDKDYCRHPRSSKTLLLVLQRGMYNGSLPVTKVLLKPITGRRHQLRVHCHHIGHTIVGDYTYSNRQDCLPYRMFLHSYRLVLHTALENIDLTTEDPFSEIDRKNKWIPQETINKLDNDAFLKLSEISREHKM